MRGRAKTRPCRKRPATEQSSTQLQTERSRSRSPSQLTAVVRRRFKRGAQPQVQDQRQHNMITSPGPINWQPCNMTNMNQSQANNQSSVQNAMFNPVHTANSFVNWPQASFTGPHLAATAPQAACTGTQTACTGTQAACGGTQAVFTGPQAAFTGPHTAFTGPHAAFTGSQAVFPGPQYPQYPYAAQPLQQGVNSERCNSGASERKGERLDIHVSAKLTDKILAGKAIDMGEIFDHDPRKQKGENMHRDSDSENECKKKVRKQASVLSSQEWLEAFSIYSFIRCEADPTIATGLMIHLNHVLELQRQGHDWQTFDLTVRRLVERGQMAFEDRAIEEKLDARRVDEPKQNSGIQHYSSGPAGVPFGFCRAYHTDKGCKDDEKCTNGYMHRCYKCKGKVPHRAIKCSMKSQRRSFSYGNKNQGQGSQTQNSSFRDKGKN